MISKVIEIFQRPPADIVLAQQLPMVTSIMPTIYILLFYLLFVLKFGKKFMEHRQPYNIKYIMLVYNFGQMIFNAILCGYGIYFIIIKDVYNLRCIESLPFDHPSKPTERILIYAYFINKILDLLDTVFFVLRKSHKQITVLHVYHHVMMVFVTYLVVRFYGAAGQYHVMGTLNTFVHTIMYFYYLVSALYPGLKGSLWWKKYITKIQIAQFVFFIVHSLSVLIFNPSCTFPLIMQYTQLSQGSVMLVMFTRFYMKAYCKPKSK